MLVLLALVTLGTVALVTFLSARLIQAPIARLNGALREIARGTFDFRISHNRRDEFGELFDQVNLIAQSTSERLNAVEAMLLDRPAPDPDPDEAPVDFTPEPIRLSQPAANASAYAVAGSPVVEDDPADVAASQPVRWTVASPVPVTHGDGGPTPPRAGDFAATDEPVPETPAVVSEPDPVSDSPVTQTPDEEAPMAMLDPPWAHDEDEDRTRMDDDPPYR
jgi:HAMP domain-containing protein